MGENQAVCQPSTARKKLNSTKKIYATKCYLNNAELKMITCYVRYVLDMNKVNDFEKYAKIWILLVNKLGGIHHGYFLPNHEEKSKEHGKFSFPGIGSEGPTNVAVALFSFPDWETYECYRTQAGKEEACKKATQIAEESKCFTSYERNFMTPLFK